MPVCDSYLERCVMETTANKFTGWRLKSYEDAADEMVFIPGLIQF